MAIKLKAQQQVMSIGPQKGKTLFVIRAEKYSTLSEDKLFSEAAVHSGMSSGAIRSAWYACGDILKNWLTEGHSIAIPGLGVMRFGVTAKAVEKIEEVTAELIKSRKVIFTPSVIVKQELDNTTFTLAYYDVQGREIKRTQSGTTPDDEPPTTDDTQNGGGSSSGGSGTGDDEVEQL